MSITTSSHQNLETAHADSSDLLGENLIKLVNIQKWLDFWFRLLLLAFFVFWVCDVLFVLNIAAKSILFVLLFGALGTVSLAWYYMNIELVSKFQSKYAADGLPQAEIRNFYYRTFPLHRQFPFVFWHGVIK